MMQPALHSKPWYREPWPWFLISLPAAAVIAGVVTIWLAATSSDGLVVGDYYKAGLAINQTLARDDAARARGLAASLRAEDGALALTLTGRLDAYPARLDLRLAHPTREGQDQALVLDHAGGGRYRGHLPALAAGKWHVQLTDDGATWRLSGVVRTPIDAPVALGTESGSNDQPTRGD